MSKIDLPGRHRLDAITSERWTASDWNRWTPSDQYARAASSESTVTGTIELRDTNGNVLLTQARTVLCRCGASTKKPFCDGTHSKIGFQAAVQAVPDSAESPSDPRVAGVSAGNVGVPAAALDAAESDGVIYGVDPADVEKAESTGSKK